MLLYFWNSLVFAVVSTGRSSCDLDGGRATSSPSSSSPAATFLFVLVLATAIVPFEIYMVPLFTPDERRSSWSTRGSGLVLPFLVLSFGIFFMRQNTTTSVPDELLDAARIDGMSETGIMLRLRAATARAGGRALAILAFIQAWTAFIWPLLILNEPLAFPDGAGSLAVRQQFASRLRASPARPPSSRCCRPSSRSCSCAAGSSRASRSPGSRASMAGSPRTGARSRNGTADPGRRRGRRHRVDRAPGRRGPRRSAVAVARLAGRPAQRLRRLSIRTLPMPTPRPSANMVRAMWRTGVAGTCHHGLHRSSEAHMLRFAGGRGGRLRGDRARRGRDRRDPRRGAAHRARGRAARGAPAAPHPPARRRRVPALAGSGRRAGSGS